MSFIYSIAADASGEFLDCVAAMSPETYETFTCLFDFIDEWLRHGTAVDDCCDDFPTFLTAVTLIVAKWHAGLQPKGAWPELEGITNVMDPDRLSYGVLDPQAFMLAKRDAPRWSDAARTVAP